MKKIVLSISSRIIGGTIQFITIIIGDNIIGKEEIGKVFHFISIALGVSVLTRVGGEVVGPRHYANTKNINELFLITLYLTIILIIVSYFVTKYWLLSEFYADIFIASLLVSYIIILGSILKSEGWAEIGNFVETAFIYIGILLLLTFYYITNGEQSIQKYQINIVSFLGTLYLFS